MAFFNKSQPRAADKNDSKESEEEDHRREIRLAGSELRGASSPEFAGRQVDCTVRNISALGATVEVGSSNGIPHEVVLEVIQRGERYACYVIWRAQGGIRRRARPGGK